MDGNTQQRLISEYFNWPIQIEHTKSIKSELNSFQVQSAVKALSYLHEQLGDKFPEDCFLRNHPMKHYFANRAPWTRAWFTWLAEALREIKASPKRDDLIRKLKSIKDEEYQEALTILEVALKCARSEFNVEIEADSLNDDKKGKKPDLKVTNQRTGEIALIEITRLTKDSFSLWIDKVHQHIFFTAADRNIELRYAGAFYKVLSETHREKIQAEIETKLLKCLEKGEFEKIVHSDVVKLGFAPISDTVVFDEWAKLHNLDVNSLTFPSTDVIARLGTKILHKSKQLNSKIPSIIVIHSNDFWMNDGDFKGVVNKLEEYIYRCKEVLAIVIIIRELGPKEKRVLTNKFNFFIERTERYAYTTKSLLIFNKFNEARLSMNTLINLYQAFEGIDE